MIKIDFNGNIREIESGISAFDFIKSVSNSLPKAACSVLVDGENKDLRTALNKNCKLEVMTFENEQGKRTYWHTASHILAQAVKRLYPKTKLAIGPATANGFYYDLDTETAFVPEDLKKIEAEMARIIKEALPIERFEVDYEDALKEALEQGEIYKAELIREHSGKGETLTCYRQGEFTDFCAGPHLMKTSDVKAIKITNCTGAYWRADSKNKMLQRIYGIAFPKQAELDEYIQKIEEAKKRDHNILGRQLGYFTTVDLIGQGLPILLPKGTKAIQLLQRFVEDEEEKRGYILTKTPLFAKSDFYKVSGHWYHYRDKMFIMGDPEKEAEEEVFCLRPMTCPFQFQVYLNKMRSYRDLPLRYNETSTLFRNEASGEMHGLIRVRQFTISEGHLACRPDQLEDEFKGCLDLAKFMLETLGLEKDVSYCFSKWDENDREKYIGSAEQWEAVQNTMRKILDDIGIDYTEEEGEAAFYGPKLDIQIKNVHGKEDTIITIQIDFQLAERFNMTYIDQDGTKKYPYVIHRTSIGCYERTLALLIEKYAGAMPTWLSYVQVKLIPITEKNHAYANRVFEELKKRGIRAEIDDRNEKMGYKIREAQMDKIPYMFILGDNEEANGTVAVRSRKSGDIGVMDMRDIIAKIVDEIATRAL